MKSMNADVRIITGNSALWVIDPTGHKKARLPLEAVDSKGMLAPWAASILKGAGFFVVPVSRAYAVTALTTTACNLGCSYCYQNIEQAVEAPSRPPRIANSNLHNDGIDKIVSFVRRQMRKNGFEATSLLLFGGEPLLNPHACLQLLRRFSELNLIRADMITNGTLLTARLSALLEQAGLQSVQITYDGARAAHDKVRITRSGDGTFDTINKRIKKAIACTSFNWNIRINVSAQNASTLGALAESLATIYPSGRSSVHFSPVFDYGVGYENRLRYSDDLAAAFIVAGRIFLQAGFKLKYAPGPRRCPYCGTSGGKTGAVINADGRLYSCWTTCGHDGWEVGDVSAGFMRDDIIAPRWLSCESEIRGQLSLRERQEFLDRVDFALLEAQSEMRTGTHRVT
jgi:uncharacterized protein